MKSFGFFCCCLLWAISAHAELDTLWSRTLPLPPQTYQLEGAALLQNGDAMLASLNTPDGDIALTRLSSEGDVAWEGTVNIPAFYPDILGMEQMEQGHLILAATVQGQDSVSMLFLKGFTSDGTELWTRSYEYPLLNYATGIRRLADNTMMLYGSVYTPQGESDPILVKVSSTGDTLWTRTVGPEAPEYILAYDVDELSNGDLVLAGSYSTPAGYEGYVMRTTPAGVPVWTNTYVPGVDQNNLFCTCINISSNNNILVGGSSGSFWWTSYPWAVSLTEDGDEIWTLEVPDNLDGGVAGIRYMNDGGAVMVASTVADFGFNHAKVMSANSEGVATLDYVVEGPQGNFYGMRNDGSRGAIAYGTISNTNWDYLSYVLRFGPSTAVTGFVREEGSNTPVEGARVELLETGDVTFTDVQGIYSLGLSQTTGTLRVTHPCITPEQHAIEVPEGEESVENFSVGVPSYLADVSSLNMVATFGMPERDTVVIENLGNGDLIFSTTVHEQTPAYGWLSVSPENGIIAPNEFVELVITVIANPEHPEFEFVGEVRVHHNSCPDTVGGIGVFVLALNSPERPRPVSEFAVAPAYPNPFNGTTSVQFSIPQESVVEFNVYDIQGRLAQTVAASRFAAGNHVVNLDLSDQATGVYLLRLQAASNISVQKLVYLK